MSSYYHSHVIQLSTKTPMRQRVRITFRYNLMKRRQWRRHTQNKRTIKINRLTLIIIIVVVYWTHILVSVWLGFRVKSIWAPWRSLGCMHSAFFLCLFLFFCVKWWNCRMIFVHSYSIELKWNSQFTPISAYAVFDLIAAKNYIHDRCNTLFS